MEAETTDVWVTGAPKAVALRLTCHLAAAEEDLARLGALLLASTPSVGVTILPDVEFGKLQASLENRIVSAYVKDFAQGLLDMKRRAFFTYFSRGSFGVIYRVWPVDERREKKVRLLTGSPLSRGSLPSLLVKCVSYKRGNDGEGKRGVKLAMREVVGYTAFHQALAWGLTPSLVNTFCIREEAGQTLKAGQFLKDALHLDVALFQSAGRNIIAFAMENAGPTMGSFIKNERLDGFQHWRKFLRTYKKKEVEALQACSTEGPDYIGFIPIASIEYGITSVREAPAPDEVLAAKIADEVLALYAQKRMTLDWTVVVLLVLSATVMKGGVFHKQKGANHSLLQWVLDDLTANRKLTTLSMTWLGLVDSETGSVFEKDTPWNIPLHSVPMGLSLDQTPMLVIRQTALRDCHLHADIVLQSAQAMAALEVSHGMEHGDMKSNNLTVQRLPRPVWRAYTLPLKPSTNLWKHCSEHRKLVTFKKKSQTVFILTHYAVRLIDAGSVHSPSVFPSKITMVRRPLSVGRKEYCGCGQPKRQSVLAGTECDYPPFYGYKHLRAHCDLNIILRTLQNALLGSVRKNRDGKMLKSVPPLPKEVFNVPEEEGEESRVETVEKDIAEVEEVDVEAKAYEEEDEEVDENFEVYSKEDTITVRELTHFLDSLVLYNANLGKKTACERFLEIASRFAKMEAFKETVTFTKPPGVSSEDIEWYGPPSIERFNKACEEDVKAIKDVTNIPFALRDFLNFQKCKV